MAVYHGDDPYLFAQAIESVFANILKPDDFVLAVDGPVPAAIDAVILRYEREYAIRAVRLPVNRGLAAALNHGLSAVRTEWVARADADDMNEPDRFLKQAEALSSLGGEVDILGGAIEEVDRSGAPLSVRAVPLEHEQIVRRLKWRSPFNHMTVVYRTSAVRAVGGYPQLYLKEDYGLWVRLIAGGARCRNVSDLLVRATTGKDMYRRRGGLAYVRSELEIQKALLRQRQTTFWWMLLLASARVTVFCLPAAIRGWIYRCLLRAPPLGRVERHVSTTDKLDRSR